MIEAKIQKNPRRAKVMTMACILSTNSSGILVLDHRPPSMRCDGMAVQRHMGLQK